MNYLTGEILTLPKMSGSVSSPSTLGGNIGAKTINIGEDGATFIPSVSDDGVISWTNDKDLPNPDPVNIKGDPGKNGYTPIKGIDYFDGKDGINGKDGYTPVKGKDYFDGKNGIDGKDGKDGVDGYTPQKNVDYFDGKDGADGKTAYQYAKDGGYTGSESDFAMKLAKECPTKLSELTNDKGYITSGEAPVQSVNGKTGAVTLNAAAVGADPAGTASTAVLAHNTDTDAHSDLRLELKAISDRLNAFFDSDDSTLDELSEIVAYITSNKTLIDSITTSKVNVSDIINNLTTNISSKPLSAAQGVILKGLIDALNSSLSNYALKSSLPTKVSQLTNDKGYLTAVPAGYATEEFVTSKIAEAELGGEDVDLSGYALKSELPKKTSQLTNDSGFVKGSFRVNIIESDDGLSADKTPMEIALAFSDGRYVYANYGGIQLGLTLSNADVAIFILNAGDSVGHFTVLPDKTVTMESFMVATEDMIPTKTSDLTNDSGFLTDYTETDPTVPAWAKAASKPSYSKSEVGLGNVDNVKQYSASNPPPYPVTSVNGKTGAVTLDAEAVSARPSTWMPSASDVGALPANTTIPSKTSQLTNDSGFATDAVRYVEQTLTEEQKARARANIGAAAKEGTETVLSDNLLDISLLTRGKVFYYGGSGYQFVDSEWTYYGFIPLRGAGTYRTKFQKSYHSSTGTRIALVNDSDVFVANATGTCGEVDTDENWVDFEFTVTAEHISSGVTKVAFDVFGNYLDKTMIVKDREYPSKYIPFGYIEVATDNGMKQDNVLCDKTVVFLGDSLCAGTTVAADSGYYGYGWGGIIGEANHMTWKNYGKNGGTITHRGSDASCIAKIADTAISEYPNADYVIFEGGCNDADQMREAGLGEVSADYATFDTTTFSGAMESLILKLVTAYPKAKIGYIIPQKMYTGYASYTAKDHIHRVYFDRAAEICRKWGIPYVDVWNGSPLNPKLSTSSIFYVEENGQHLTIEGYQAITPLIEGWMRDMHITGNGVADLSGYATEKFVGNMISAAIGNAIGGSY